MVLTDEQREFMKTKMSTSYLAIFSISILMIFVNLIMAGLSGSSSAIGIYYWGYTAWKMHKRENENLLSFHKIFMWIALVGTLIVCAILAINSSSESFIGVSFGVMLVFGALSSLISFGLMQYFKQQKIINVVHEGSNKQSGSFKTQTKLVEPVLSEVTKFPIKENTVELKPAANYREEMSENILMDINMIDDEKIWEQAFDEFNSESRRKGLWAKLLVEFNGDNEKAKVNYFKERFEQIKLDHLNEMEQAKQREIQAKESERLAIIEMTKKLPIEECISKGYFELKEHKTKSYYIFPNGEASIKRKDEHRIYVSEISLINAIDVYLVTELLPREGFLRSYKEKLTEVEIKNKKFVDALERNSYKFKGYDIEGEGENKWCFLYHGNKIYFNEDELKGFGKNFL